MENRGNELERFQGRMNIVEMLKKAQEWNEIFSTEKENQNNNHPPAPSSFVRITKKHQPRKIAASPLPTKRKRTYSPDDDVLSAQILTQIQTLRYLKQGILPPKELILSLQNTISPSSKHALHQRIQSLPSSPPSLEHTLQSLHHQSVLSPQGNPLLSISTETHYKALIHSKMAQLRDFQSSLRQRLLPAPSPPLLNPLQLELSSPLPIRSLPLPPLPPPSPFDQIPLQKQQILHLSHDKRLLSLQVAQSIQSRFLSHQSLLLEEKTRMEKSRLLLLKEANFEEYLSLVKSSKDSRLKQLVNTTQEFLDDLQKKTSIPLFQQTSLPSVSPPSSLLHPLLPHQITGLSWMYMLYQNSLSGILADEMGLGKTIQTIALLSLLHEQGNAGPHLIVVPLSTLPNWHHEFTKWCPSLKVLSYRGHRPLRKALAKTFKHHHVIITTYDYVMKDHSYFKRHYWEYLVIDEGHRLKNSISKFHLRMSQLSSRFRLLLTGTPLQNNLNELWSLLNFIMPTVFSGGGSFDQWFCDPWGGSAEDGKLTQEEEMVVIGRLHQMLRPFLLRRVKKEVLGDLPEKKEIIISVPMSAAQWNIYRQLTLHYLQAGERVKQETSEGTKRTGQREERKMIDDESDDVQIVEEKTEETGTEEVFLGQVRNTVMHLRKVVSHPYMFTDREEGEDECWDGEEIFQISGKMEALDRIVTKLLPFNHKILIFSQMARLLRIIERYFEFKKIPVLYLDGSVPLSDREERMKTFNDPESVEKVFLISTRAGGTGLNLQTADTVIIFDSDWNPHQDLQAMARAHRVGQMNEVRVLRFISRCAFEEYILKKALRKLSIDRKIIQAGLFHETGTDKERETMLEKVFLETSEEERRRKGKKLTTPVELNAFLARSEEEFSKFQEMDEKEIFADSKRLLKLANEKFEGMPYTEIIRENMGRAEKEYHGAEEKTEGDKEEDSEAKEKKEEEKGEGETKAEGEEDTKYKKTRMVDFDSYEEDMTYSLLVKSKRLTESIPKGPISVIPIY